MFDEGLIFCQEEEFVFLAKLLIGFVELLVLFLFVFSNLEVAIDVHGRL